MNLEALEKVIELARKHGIHQIEVEDKDLKVVVTTTAPQVHVGSAAHHPMTPVYAAPMPQSVAYQAPTQSPAMAPLPAQAVEREAKAPTTKGRILKSPFVGTFYRSSAPGADPMVDIGKRVKKGDALCIIEAMKLMNEIEAEFDGVIREILVENEQPVEFDQPLFVIE